MLKTPTTRSPLPPWFPLTSPTSSFGKSQNLRENATRSVLSPNNGSSLHDSIRSGSNFDPSATTDCPDPEHNNCGNSHWVKVPKVPYDYDYIKNNSKPHFPIDLPGDNSNHHLDDHDIDFEQNSERSNEAPLPTPSPKKPTVSIQVLPNFTQYCPPARSRNLFWNWTLAVSVFINFIKLINFSWMDIYLPISVVICFFWARIVSFYFSDQKKQMNTERGSRYEILPTKLFCLKML